MLKRLILVLIASTTLVGCAGLGTSPSATNSSHTPVKTSDPVEIVSDPVPTGVTTPHPPTDTAPATVVYEFHDASVPPEYHRSYTLTVTESQADFVVDSYGDIISTDSAPIDSATWTDISTSAMTHADDADINMDGCTGGTGETLSALNAEGQEIFSVYVSHCNNAGAPDLSFAVIPLLNRFTD